MSFSCSFTNSPTDCGFSEQAAGNRASLTSTARDGTTGVRLYTQPGDSNIAGSGSNERDDLTLSVSATGCAQGNERWYAHSIYLPNDYVIPPTGSTWNWGILFDFHHTGSTGQPNFEIVAIPTGLQLWVAGGQSEVQGPGPGLTQTNIGPIVKNQWYDFVYHVKWSSNSDGYFQATLNGTQVMNYSGPTLYAGEQCYMKLANYHTPIGQTVAVIHDRIIVSTTQAGLGSVGSTTPPPATTPPPVTTPPIATGTQRVAADFDGDKKSDILWRNTSNGQNTLWMMNAGTIMNGPALSAQTDTGWKIVGVADFDGDGKADILWRHPTGKNEMWLMNGGTRLSAPKVMTVTDANWQVYGVGDFNGDGKADILWRNSATGDVNIWLMNGATYASGANVATVADPQWVIAGVGDFDGDGKSDILWRNKTTGMVNLWLMNGTALAAGPNVATVADLNWTIVGVGDFDGSGRSDILWRNRVTGENAVMYVNGTTVSALTPLVRVADLNWTVAGVADFNGDGKADILWRNTATGETKVFFMSGTSLLGAADLPIVPVAWSVEIN